MLNTPGYVKEIGRAKTFRNRNVVAYDISVLNKGDVRLSGVERLYLRVECEYAPPGHVPLGPFKNEPYLWLCLVCGREWVNGHHPQVDENPKEIEWAWQERVDIQ